MANKDGPSDIGTVLEEDELKRMSRHIRVFVPETAASVDVVNKLAITFDNVLASAASAGLNASHRVAAWNTLCALIDRTRSSDEESFRNLFWAGDVWNRAFDLYLSQGHLARPKSARQLLASLTAALSNDECSQERPDLTKTVAQRLIKVLDSGDDHGRAKTGALALGHFLSKDVLLLDTVLEARASADPPAMESRVGAELEGLLLMLFKWMGKGDFGSTIGQVVSAVLDRSSKLHASSVGGLLIANEPVWVSALRTAVKSKAIEPASLRVHLLPMLFRRSTSDYFALLRSLDVEHLSGEQRDQSAVGRSCEPSDRELLYTSLQAGKDHGLLWETDDAMLKQEGGVVFLPTRWIGRLSIRASRSARLTGLSLLISSHAATRPLTPRTLRLIKRNLSHYFADTDANFRSEVFSLMQRLVDRVRAITAVLTRQSSRPVNDGVGATADPIGSLQHHRNFLDWLVRFLAWELRPTASYQRHISALRCLSTLVRSGVDENVLPSHLSKSALGETRWSFHMALMPASLHRLLLDLLVDPFDDVRQTAASILSVYISQDSSSQERNRLALSRAEKAMLATGRADQADGVAHLYTLLHDEDQSQPGMTLEAIDSGSAVLIQLINRLEQMLRIAEVDLSEAVDRYPVHGLLTSIRYILCQERVTTAKDLELWDRFSVCLHDVWEVVKPILCNDAPEGYLPEGVIEEQPDVTTKDTLSYCWRALKEASLLLGVLVSTKTERSPGGEQEDDVRRLQELCDLCFSQLAELRHRGAFSTVAQTWTICCMHSVALPGGGGIARLNTWYANVLSILRNKTTINTRRSAGLPSLLCGLLIAEPSGELMRRAFGDLETIAREAVDPAFAQEGSLAQVHAMNCMKDILKNGRLGEQSERHVPSALKLAADALRSQAWAVRNCGLMLFRAVIDRLLGTSDAHLEDDGHAQKKLSAEQHPELLGIVLGLLVTSTSPAGESSSVGNEGVFPALQLLQRLSVPEDRLPQIQHSVRALTASPVWHVRDKAARTYASLVVSDQSAMELELLLQTPTARQNALHGALLSAKYIVHALITTQSASGNKKTPSMCDLSGRCMLLVLDAVHLYHENPCPATRAAYLDLHTECLTTMNTFRSSETLSAMPEDSHWLVDTLFDWEAVLDEAQKDSAAPLILPSLATAFVAQLASMDTVTAEQYSLVNSVIVKVASQDSGACVALFRAFSTLLLGHDVAARLSQVTVLAECCIAILNKPAVDTQLRCQVVETSLDMVNRLHTANMDNLPLCKLVTTLDVAPGPVSARANQRYADLWLQLKAVSIEHQIRQRDAVPNLESWADACCAAVTGSGFYSPEAAAHAIGRMDSLWSSLATNASASDVLLRLCLAVYDLLNDDDEDIRDIASKAACRILATESKHCAHEDLVPGVASQELLAFFVRRWPDDLTLVSEAFSRAFGISSMTTVSVAERLQDDTATDTALFAAEKQNLYIDEAREVKAWSQALLRLPAHAAPKALLKTLGMWVTDGLTAMINTIGALPDGALSWTTKPELFLLGLQVVYGAEVLLHHADQGVRLSVRPSSIRRQLAELASLGDNGGINCLWQSEIDRVVLSAVICKMQRVHVLLKRLETHI